MTAKGKSRGETRDSMKRGTSINNKNENFTSYMDSICYYSNQVMKEVDSSNKLEGFNQSSKKSGNSPVANTPG